MILPRPSRGPRSLPILSTMASSDCIVIILLLDHYCKLLLLTPIDPLQIHIENPQPLIILYLVGLSTAAINAGVVDSDIQTSKLSHDLCNPLLDLR